MEILDQLTCLLRNLYAGQEATVRNGHEITDWLKIEKWVQGCICHPAYLTYIQNIPCEMAGLDEALAGMKIARGNIQ